MDDIFPPVKRAWLTDADIREAMAPPWEKKSWGRDKPKPHVRESMQSKFVSSEEAVVESSNGGTCLPNGTTLEMDIDVDGRNDGAAGAQENRSPRETPTKIQHKSTSIEANAGEGPSDSNVSNNYGVDGADDMILDPTADGGTQEAWTDRKTGGTANPDTIRQDALNASGDQDEADYLSSPAESEDSQAQRASNGAKDRPAQVETIPMNIPLPPKSRVNSGVIRNGNGSGTTRDAFMLPYMANSFHGPLHFPHHNAPIHNVLTQTVPTHTVPAYTIPTHTVPTHTIPTHTVPTHIVPIHNTPIHNIPTHHTPINKAYTIRPRDAMEVAIALELALGERKRIFDLVCVGFGPASLAIAIAIADKWAKSSRPLPKVLFIEKQPAFAWHSGMQVPSAKMQISFLKDLATPRDPTSPFTFLNYLHMKNRLAAFTNLSTFMPSRMEFEDYMQWCASFFGGVVKYHTEVQSVEPEALNEISKKVPAFKVKFKANNNLNDSVIARHVVIAVGGKPYVPPDLVPFTTGISPRVTHSTHYTSWIKMHNSRVRNKSFKTIVASLIRGRTYPADRS
jgi:L-lysine 6-monooxygenase (NADPH-requiring)